jgi:ornithine carbamoyltransferase
LNRKQEMTKYSPVPVLNALSSLWHPTQILADLLTLHEHSEAFAISSPEAATPENELATKTDGEHKNEKQWEKKPFFTALPTLRPLTIAYLGDSTNVLHDMLVTYPRFGHKLRVATPLDAKYQCPEPVWARVKELECAEHISWSADPREAVRGADVVVTDTWFVFFKTVQKPHFSPYIPAGSPWARRLRKRSACRISKGTKLLKPSAVKRALQKIGNSCTVFLGSKMR